jgi:Domain of unknown function (DUF4062)/AAA ATPase domain
MAVKRAIESLQLTPVMFEQGASPHPPRNLYRSYLDQSHVFVAIYWQRYGWIAPDMDISGLEDEYRLSNGKPRLVYVKRPAPEREPGLEAMLDDIRDKAGISYKPFSTPAELEEVVSQDLVTLLSERFQTGRDQTTKRRIETRMRGPVPVPPSDLIGRDEELAALAELLVDDGTRLVTLTGPGGVGKTRLAVETARGLVRSFPGGIFFVPLASIEDPERVPASIVRALGLSRRRRHPRQRSAWTRRRPALPARPSRPADPGQLRAAGRRRDAGAGAAGWMPRPHRGRDEPRRSARPGRA